MNNSASAKKSQPVNLTAEALKACEALIAQSEKLNAQISEYTLAGSPGRLPGAWKVYVVRLDAEGNPPAAADFHTLFDDLPAATPPSGPGHGDS